ncbi:MAG: histidinol dehydrogenase [Ferrimicrobium sp.]
MGLLCMIDLREVMAGAIGRFGLPRPTILEELPISRVREIVERVRVGGDEAVLDFGRAFDGVAPTQLVYDRDDLARAAASVSSSLLAALNFAHDRVARLYEGELPVDSVIRDGDLEITRRHIPVARAGCYVPGGAARYPSSVIHTATVAVVAGVSEVIVVSPPTASGAVDEATLAAAHIAGVDRVIASGGAQAIAALAYGTESVPKVDVIVGPGNIYVSVAKQLVSGVVGVPTAFAGPSEVVVVADATVPPEFAAIDVAVQAEHGPHGLAWLVTWDEGYARLVEEALAAYVARSPRADSIASTLAEGGYVAVVRDRDQAIELVDEIAPEHLELLYDGAQSDALRVRNAGAIFVGRDATAAIGDYVAGPSHVLPTFGSARYASVLSIEDFVKRVHTVSVGPGVIDDLGWAVEEIARSEGLVAHAESVGLRRRRGRHSQ